MNVFGLVAHLDVTVGQLDRPPATIDIGEIFSTGDCVGKVGGQDGPGSIVVPAFGRDSALRVDPHPAWDRTRRLFTFNMVQDGIRRVAIADCSVLIQAG